MAADRLAGLISLDGLVLRTDSHKGAAVSDEDVFDCARTGAA